MPTVSFNQHFPGYEILGELGRSNARVLKARNQVTGELVAIKHFALNTDPETIRRFQRESEIMTSIRHPYIVKIKDVQLEADLPYIVMELVEGGDLRSLLKERGHLDISTTIRLGLQMLEALSAIHEKGIIHRDIKPENIMYRYLHSNELHFLITDFGIAKLREQPGTMTGSAMLTYEYASPEQFDNPKGIGFASDYYSLGVVLYECLAGSVPFPLVEGRVHTLMNQVMGSSPPALHLPAGNLAPGSLQTLINALLAKTETNRITDPARIKKMLKRAEIEHLEEPEDPLPPPPAYTPSRTMPAPLQAETAVLKETPMRPKKERSYTFITVIFILAVTSLLVFLIKENREENKKAGQSNSKKIVSRPGSKGNLPVSKADSESVMVDSVDDEPSVNLKEGVFYDDFSDNEHQWGISSDSNKLMSVANGKLSLEGLKNNYSYSTAQPFNIDLKKDYSVSVNTRWVKGNTDAGFGLNYNSNITANSFYVFFISSNGQYSILYCENNGDWHSIRDWTRSDFINKNNTLNVLAISKEADMMKFFINDNLVETSPYHGAFGNAFGVRVSGSQKVEFDNFILKGE